MPLSFLSFHVSAQHLFLFNIAMLLSGIVTELKMIRDLYMCDLNTFFEIYKLSASYLTMLTVKQWNSTCLIKHNIRYEALTGPLCVNG